MILEKLPKNTQFSSQQASDESLLVAVHLSWLISKAHSLQPLFDQIKRNIPFLFVILFHKLDLVRTGEFWVLYSVKFLHSPVVLSSLPRYARQSSGRKQVARSGNWEKPNKGTILKVWTPFRETNKEYCNSLEINSSWVTTPPSVG